jgi:hypothetical protein
MSQPYSNLFSKCEQAFASLVLSKAPMLSVFPGQSSAIKMAPCTIAYAENSSEEDPMDSGNYWVNAQVEICYPAPVDADGVDPKPANDFMVQTVMDILQSTTLAADLRAQNITDFTAQGIRARNQGFHISEDLWVNVWSCQVLCCASTLPA